MYPVIRFRNSMFLPKTQEYALRCMAQIALMPWETSLNADQLSQLTGVPRSYISKVLQKLTSAKLLVGEKGHGGGFKLARPPSTITFSQILEASGFTIDPDHCISGWVSCNLKNPCPLHSSFSRLKKTFFDWASKTSLSEVSSSAAVREQLKNLSQKKAARKNC